MKNLLVLLTLALMFSFGACTTQNADVTAIIGNDTVMIEGNYMYTFIVDSCEYIGSGYSGMTHKGNCRFCAEREAKKFGELDSLITRSGKLIEELKNRNVTGSSTYSSYPYSY